MNRVLVVGGSYFVGKYIVENLVKDGFKVTTLNRGTKGKIFGDEVEYIFCDRNNSNEMEEKLSGRTFDYVIDTSILNNHHAEIIYECLNKDSIKKYFFISSSAVYSPSNELPINEEGIKGANEYWQEYGIDKYEAERFFLEQFKKSKFPVVILRPPYIYGEGNYIYRESFFFERVLNNQQIIVPNYGETLVQFIHIEDLYKCILELCRYSEVNGQAFNIGNIRGITFKGFIELCMNVAGRNTEIKQFDYKKTDYKCRDFFPFHDYQYMLDTRKLEKYFVPKVSMIEGLKRSFEWYKSNQDKVKRKDKYEINSKNILEIIK